MPRKIITTTQELIDFLMLINNDEHDVIAWDIETNEYFSDDIWHGKQMSLHGIGLYVSKKIQCYIVHNQSIDYEPLDMVLHEMPLVFHNAKFDLPILERLWILTNVDWIELHDTMLMSYIDKEDRFSHGLKKLTETVLKKKPEEIVKFWSVMDKPRRSTDTNLFTDQDALDKQYEEEMDTWLQNMANYCMDDCEHTYKLYKFFRDKLESIPSLWKLYTKLEIPFMKVLIGMEKNWITIDKEYLSNMEVEAKQVLDDLEKEIYIEAGKKFDINSSQQLGKILFEERWYTPPPDTKTSTWANSTWVEALKGLVKEYECNLSALVLKYREISKLQTTYITSIPKLSLDWKIHCSRNQIWTRTGRLSSSKPNLQNIPRREDQFNIRAAFKPSKGNKFIICDYSQQELRIMAYFSQDPWLIKAYQDWEDIHQVTADKMWCSRFIAKTINFGLNYGRTAHWLAKWLGITKTEAQNFIDIYFKSYPKVQEFMTKAVNTVKKYKYIETIVKRRRRFDNYNKVIVPKGFDMDRASPDQKRQRKKEMHIRNSKIERMATNTIIQGSSADMMKIAMLKLEKKLKDYWAFLVLQIHDEVVVECPEDKAEEVMKVVEQEMVNAVDLKWIPVIAEPKIASEWEK